jgi:hypothetical protein
MQLDDERLASLSSKIEEAEIVVMAKTRASRFAEGELRLACAVRHGLHNEYGEIMKAIG